MVENMSMYVCSSCGHEAHIFGNGGAEKCAEEMDLDFLGGIPLHESIRSRADVGEPIVFTEPNSPMSAYYLDIADKVVDRMKKVNSKAAGPSIIME